VSDETWIRATIHAAAWGTLATVHDGQPFLNSNLFVYDEARHALYLHTARVGRTPATVRAGGAAGVPVCFGVFSMGRMLPADEALEFSVEYEGVTVFGRAHVVGDDEEAEHGLQRLLDKYAPHLRPGRDYRAITTDELKRTAVYRVDIESWAGKRKEVASDFPGAFHYSNETREV
jgi:nitroimidazol reductase NimA-like FMN-containing flavoprotein (pyridoxamine 5'-phosphate oxidase superfamily)